MINTNRILRKIKPVRAVDRILGKLGFKQGMDSIPGNLLSTMGWLEVAEAYWFLKFEFSRMYENLPKFGCVFRLGFPPLVLCTMLDIYRQIWSAIRVKKDCPLNVQIF